MRTPFPATDRWDKQLQDLLNGNRFKQALNLCEKRLKKGGKSEELLVTKVNILLVHPEPARRVQGRRELDEILGRPYPISETEALVALNGAAQARKDHDPRIQMIWERAVGVRPQDEGLYIIWFKVKFLERNWTAAQKAAMMYMKKFPEKREPFFWNIVTCELAGSQESASETDKRVLRPLAHGFLSRAAAEVATSKQFSKNGRALSTLEDVLLLLKVYRAQQKYTEALLVLDDPRTAINSPLGKNSWELVRQKIELYEICKHWNELWQFCKELLEDAHPHNTLNKSRSPFHQFGTVGDDWKMWAGLLLATREINSSEILHGTEQLLDFYLTPTTISRNARLAWVKFRAENRQEDLLLACYGYFQEYGSKVICFRDLQPYIGCLKKPLQDRLIRLLAQNTRRLVRHEYASQSKRLKWITSEINALKIDYYLIVSHEDTPKHRALLRAFVSNSIRLYKISLSINIKLPVSERRPGDDAAILAVMGLMQLLEYGEKSVVLQCIATLEFLILNSPHNYDALLTLVRLYMRVGAASLAMELHSRLSIKNLQQATVSWILYTRISTIHPYAPSSTRANPTPINSSKNLSHAIDWHRSAEELNVDSISQMLDNGQYSMLFDALEIDKSVKASFSKYMFIVESHRIGRFSQFSEIEDYSELLDEIPSKTVDTRDRTAFPDAEAAGQVRFEDLLECGASPDDQWLRYQVRIIEFWNFLRTKRGNLTTTLGSSTDEFHPSSCLSFTAIEVELYDIMDMLILVCIVYHHKPRNANLGGKARHQPQGQRNHLEDLLRNICSWSDAMAQAWMSAPSVQKSFPCKTCTDAGDLDWEFFHIMFMVLEISQLMIQTLDYVLAENSLYPVLNQGDLAKRSNCIKESIVKLCANVHWTASNLINRLRVASNASMIIDAAFGNAEDSDNNIGWQIRALIGTQRLEQIAASLCSCWIEALEGILRTKVG